VIGMVLVSHSRGLAEGLRELLAQLQPEIPVRAAGGLPDGSLGTSADVIHEALTTLNQAEGILVLVDLGSAAMSAEMAIEMLPEPQRARVLISDAPLVEGATLAAINAGLGLPLAAVAEAAQEGRHLPKNLQAAPAGTA
jgi:PTS hybrid protein